LLSQQHESLTFIRVGQNIWNYPPPGTDFGSRSTPERPEMENNNRLGFLLYWYTSDPSGKAGAMATFFIAKGIVVAAED